LKQAKAFRRRDCGEYDGRTTWKEYECVGSSVTFFVRLV
jgi:hypothetical protein